MSSLRVLILENQSVVALDLASILEARGCDPVIVCETAELADRSIDIAVPDAGVLDIELAERDACLAIATRLAGNACPVLLIADDMALPEHLSGMHGACHHIEKPFSETCFLSAFDMLTAEKSQGGVERPCGGVLRPHSDCRGALAWQRTHRTR
ncbi:hypothetical protein PVV74_03855 [Roseovarius sp. SK2]|uniref:hypothetical protein n=1 Tax=Roseovarius TaxID=74030 RepID=UPI00237AA61D|nr:hypothetical protein [Roseovarius sp. SK2]MDD9724584.1 hypothetical protein [Roseovarius sp. SK2]